MVCSAEFISTQNHRIIHNITVGGITTKPEEYLGSGIMKWYVTKHEISFRHTIWL